MRGFAALAGGLATLVLMAPTASATTSPQRVHWPFEAGSPNPAVFGELDTADFNGDSHVDVVVSGTVRKNGERRSGIYLLAGRGDGTFKSPDRIGPAFDKGFQLVSLDGDAQLDAIGYDECTLENTDCSFSTRVDSIGGRLAVADRIPLGRQNVQHGDFDGDGYLDIAKIRDRSTFEVQYGLGDGTFGLPKQVTAELGPDGDLPENEPYAAYLVLNAAGDLTGDGQDDLLASIGRNFDQDADIASFISAEDRTFEQVASGITREYWIGLPHMFDLDADGNNDVVTDKLPLGDVPRVFLGDGAGGLEKADTEFGLSAQTCGISDDAMDLDGDSNLDVFGSCGVGPDQGSLFVEYGDGAGGYERQAFERARGSAAPPELADFDEDGDTDLATMRRGDGFPKVKSGLEIQENGGTPQVDKYPFKPSFTNREVKGDFRIAEIGIGGEALVLSGRSLDKKGLFYLRSKVNGAFNEPRRIAENYRGQFEVPDLNGDRFPDAIGVQRRGDEETLVARIGQRRGTWEAVQTFPSLAQSFALGDFDDDGNLDVAQVDASSVRSGSQDIAVQDIVVRYGAGDGTFGESVVTTVSLEARDPFFRPRLTGLVPGDLSGDSADDLTGLVDNLNSGGPLVTLISAPGRTFAQGESGTGNEVPSAGVSADLNDDGLEDVVITHVFGNGAVDAFLSDGSGGLDLSAESIGTDGINAEPAVPAVGDLNRDFVPDLFGSVRGPQAGNFVAYGDGAGEFPSIGREPGARGEAQIVGLADLDSDGNLDVVLNRDGLEVQLSTGP